MSAACEMGDWEVVGSDNELHSVHIHALSCTEEAAVERAIHRVRTKYGPRVDLSRWTFSVWVQGRPEAPSRFRADAEGRAARLDS